MLQPRQGDIYRVISGDEADHFVIIVSHEKFNRGSYVVAVPVTSKRVEQRWTLSNCVSFASGDYCFNTKCVARCERISLLTKQDVDMTRGPLAQLERDDVARIVAAIGEVIHATCLSADSLG